MPPSFGSRDFILKTVERVLSDVVPNTKIQTLTRNTPPPNDVDEFFVDFSAQNLKSIDELLLTRVERPATIGAPVVRELCAAVNDGARKLQEAQASATDTAAATGEVMHKLSSANPAMDILEAATRANECATRTKDLASQKVNMDQARVQLILQSLQEDQQMHQQQRIVRNLAQNLDGHHCNFLGTPGGDAAHIIPKIGRKVGTAVAICLTPFQLYSRENLDPFHVSSVMILGPLLHPSYDTRSWSLFHTSGRSVAFLVADRAKVKHKVIKMDNRLFDIDVKWSSRSPEQRPRLELFNRHSASTFVEHFGMWRSNGGGRGKRRRWVSGRPNEHDRPAVAPRLG